MLQVQALAELLEENRFSTQREILERVKRLQAQAATRPM
jgi:arginine repressor